MPGRWTTPVATLTVTSPFNPLRLHPTKKIVMPHQGADFRAPTGTTLFAASGGTVVTSEFAGDPAGHYVRIDVGDRVWIGYSHLSERLVAPGDRVEAGDVIGLAGATGAAQGAHLHFEVCSRGVKTDPVPFLAERLGRSTAQRLAVSEEEDDMRDDERNMLFHIGALLAQTPLRTAQQVWGQPVHRVEGQPTTILQDTVDGTTAALEAHIELAAMTAAVQALAADRGLDTAAVSAAARAGARAAISRAPQVDVDEEALAQSLVQLLPSLIRQLEDDQLDELRAALDAERTRRGPG